jgi:large subunit ribosomal protein L31e
MAEENKTPEKAKTPAKPASEKEFVIPLREKCRPVACYKKTNKAVKTVKEFIVRHMKIRDRDLRKVKIDSYLNETLWSRGIKNPPHKIKVKVHMDAGNAIVELADMPKKLEAKRARAEKMEKAAAEAGMKKKKPAKPEEKPEEKTEEQKKEEAEKKAAGAEEAAKMEKAAAKKIKHTAKGSEKAPQVQRKALSR